jgi:hypothetical protein
MKTRKVRKGGRFYGKGTFGAVMGNPRMLCPDEELEDIEGKNEVGKIMSDKDVYDNETNVIPRLREYISDSDIDMLREYVVLPIKSCKIDISQVKRHNIYKNNEWFKDSVGEKSTAFRYKKSNGKFIMNDEPLNNMYQIIYPVGTQPFDERLHVLTRSRKSIDIYTLFLEMGHLFKGLQKIQEMDIAHNDVKVENVLFIDGKLKFIDVERLSKITKNPAHNLNRLQTQDNIRYLTDYPLYYPWSHDLILLYLLINPFDDPISELFNEEIFDMSQILYNELTDLFTKLKTNKFGFSEKIINELYLELIDFSVNRFYGLTGLKMSDGELTPHKFNLSNIMKSSNRLVTKRDKPTTSGEIVLRAYNDYLTFKEKYNTIPRPNTKETVEAVLNYILKKNDIYSMGFILLRIINGINIDHPTPQFIEITERVIRHALLCMRSKVPTNFHDYYSSRSTYFNYIYESYNQIVIDINHMITHEKAVHLPLPPSPVSPPRSGSPRPRTPRKSRSPKHATRKTSKRRTPTKSGTPKLRGSTRECAVC